MTSSRITVLGATGSIGRSTLDVIARHPQRFVVEALTAQSDVAGMLTLCQQHRPRVVAMAQDAAAQQLQVELMHANLPIEVLSGARSIADLAADSQSTVIMSAIVGAAGLLPTLAAVRAGKRVLVANKEPLVMAGSLLMQLARKHNAVLLPVDSEHNAIFQCLPQPYRCGEIPCGVQKLILTASGGPFRCWDTAQLAEATPAQAIRHPNWDMGKKISVDSATLMNKGLEFIEAVTLFGLSPDEVDVVIHPESVIHSLVEFLDGSLLAQLGESDMRIPITNVLGWPDRINSGVKGLDLTQLNGLHFERPDLQRFPCLGLARQAMQSGSVATNVLNAANEVAVQAFLDERLRFNGIPQLVERCLTAGHSSSSSQRLGAESLDAILATDQWARQWCEHALTAGELSAC